MCRPSELPEVSVQVPVACSLRTAGDMKTLFPRVGPWDPWALLCPVGFTGGAGAVSVLPFLWNKTLYEIKLGEVLLSC